MVGSTLKRALFLDRDGVINEDRRYVHRIGDFHFINGVFDLCRAAVDAGMAIIAVRNQVASGEGSSQNYSSTPHGLDERDSLSKA